MKDYLGEHDFWNASVKNPTQNKYVRFFNSPHGLLTSRYWNEDLKNSFFKDRLKSVYFGDFND